MTDLTTEQRHQVYVKALLILGDKSPYMCDCLHDACYEYQLKNDPDIYDPEWLLNNFPEFKEQKPNEEDIVGLGWFPAKDEQSRINVLTKCIELTK